MKKTLPITLLMATLVIAVLFVWKKPAVLYKVTHSMTGRVQRQALPVAAPLEQKPENILNLALPEKTFLVDHDLVLPESPHKLNNLFDAKNKEDTVSVGGHLILKDKPPDPNAAIWDNVKGAEVGITIKTP